MDLLLICNHALANSLLTNLTMAKEAKNAGLDAGVLFTSEALQAITEGVFTWPRELMEQRLRFKIVDNGKTMGIPAKGRGDGRQVDVLQLVTEAKAASIPMFACPLWTGLLGFQGKIPQGIQEIDIPTMLKMLQEAKSIIGAF